MTKYEIKNTTQFKKDYKLAKRRGLDINLLKGIITKLANGEVLAPKHKDQCFQRGACRVQSMTEKEI